MAGINFSFEADPENKAQIAMFEQIESGEEITIQFGDYKIAMKGRAKFHFKSGDLVKIVGALGDCLTPLEVHD